VSLHQKNIKNLKVVLNRENMLKLLPKNELCRMKVKDGGIIAGHDYCQGNINDVLAYGVVQAVNQFCIKYDYEFIYLTHETHRFLSFAIKKIR